MFFRPTALSARPLAVFMALGLLLRSFIAPGFMLDTGNGLAIIFCGGAGGAIPALQESVHDGHHAAHGSHDDAGPTQHITPACKDWSTSANLVVASVYELLPRPQSAPFVDSVYQPPFVRLACLDTCITRGPPALS